MYTYKYAYIYVYIIYFTNKNSKSNKIIEICKKNLKNLFVNIVVSWISEKDDDDDDWLMTIFK